MDQPSLDSTGELLSLGVSRRAVVRSVVALASGGLLGLDDVDARACPVLRWCSPWRSWPSAPSRDSSAPEVEASATGAGDGPAPEARRSDGEGEVGGRTGSVPTSNPTPTQCTPGTVIGYRTVTRYRTVCRYENGAQICAVESYTEMEPIYC
jgi:hypothetical protein